MAFVGQEEIIKVVSEAVLGIINNIYPHKNLREQIIPHYDYSYVMEHYSSDKPDLRYGLIMSTITDLVRDCGFNVFTNVIRQ
jgi:aspartyl-tRNA synthetase